MILTVAFAAGAAFGPFQCLGQVNVNFELNINSPSDFYQPLSSEGAWVDVAPYGRCWHPAQVAADWQPYTNGHWEWTDMGWYWQSDEPWAWACYHYGSWVDSPPYGWCWLPGTQWAPAWVVWRESPDYIGWAPCGPNRTVLSPNWFVFCDVHRFGEPIHRRDLIVNNRTIIDRTRVINDFKSEDVHVGGRAEKVSVNRGPAASRIERVTKRTFKPRAMTEVIQSTPVPESFRRRSASPAETRPEREQQKATPERGRPEAEHPSSTGRDQQRTYQAPEQRHQEQQFAPQAPEPKGRQDRQDRSSVQPQPPPPTGRIDRNSENHAQPQTNPRPEAPAPPQVNRPPSPAPEARPQQAAPPPTGRENNPRMSPPPGQLTPPGHERAPQAPPEDRGHGHDGHDNGQ